MNNEEPLDSADREIRGKEGVDEEGWWLQEEERANHLRGGTTKKTGNKYQGKDGSRKRG